MWTYYVYTTTNSLTSCLVKLSVLAFTLFVSICCAFISQDDESMNTFYITAFLQSVNTAYDELNFFVCNEAQVNKALKIAIVIVIICQVLVAIGSLLYLVGAVFLDNKIIVAVMILFTSTPVLFLIGEIFVHFSLSEKD